MTDHPGSVIDLAVERARYLWAETSGIHPLAAARLPGSCTFLSVVVREVLQRSYNIPTVLMGSDYIKDRTNHTFLQTTETERPLIIDPTWQLFLPGDTLYDTLPLVMLAPVGNLDKVLENHQIPEFRLSVWQQWHERPIDPRRLQEESVNHIFDTQDW